MGRLTLPPVQALDLGGNSKVGDQGVVLLAEELLHSKNSTLNSLGLRKVGLEDDGATALAALLASPHCALSNLDVSVSTWIPVVLWWCARLTGRLPSWHCSSMMASATRALPSC